MKYIKTVLSFAFCLVLFAGTLQAAPAPRGTNPTACTFTGALTTTDLTMVNRLFRPGAPTGSCAAAYTTPTTFGPGPYYYDTYAISNTTGTAQCVTFSLSTTDVASNIQFAVYTNTFNPADLITTYLADPGLSTAGAVTPITAAVTVPNGANLILVVYSANATTTGTAGQATNYTLVANNLNCAVVTPCSGTPNPGNTISTASTVCPGISFTLSPQNATIGSGVTYQWQSGPSATGPFTNIPGATNSTYTATQTAATYYQVIVTCGGNSGTSTPVQVLLTPPSGCYCTPAASNCSLQDDILNVTFAGINNTSTCSANGYADYTAGTPASVIAGATYPISVTIDLGGNDWIGVWIDYDHSGTFDASEFKLVGTTAGGTVSNTLTIPATALSGNTRMRVRSRYGVAIAGTDPCTTFVYGETEDYTVNIAACVPVQITTQPVDQSVQCSGTATFTVATTGSAPVYQWEVRTTPTGIWQNVTNGTTGGVTYSGATTATLTVSGVTAAISGYQYRAIVSGACAGATPSNAATLTVTPLVATVNPVNATICTGGIQQLTITNINSPASTSGTFNSTTTSAIPDNLVTGVTNNITVSGIPAGAVVTGISVKLNMTHTWDGDMVFALKGPNAAILNLDYYLTGTGGAGATTGFVNTVISSTGTTALSAGTNPYTGTFKADLAPGTSAPPAGPTGYNPTITAWTGLYSVPNGTWTLAMYDGGAGDVGTLTSWSITITYLVGTPATGIFSGPAGTIFTNAAGTTPYNGTTPVNTVYVAPTATGVNNYTVVVTGSTGCASAPLTIPVTLNAAVTGTPTVANVAACAGSNATFSVNGITGGTGLTYQWQVSTLAVPAFTNIAGATSATYTVPATAALNGNQYRVIIGSAGCAATLTSTAGTLTVNPIPVVTLSAAPIVNIFPGLTSTLTTAVSSATSPLTYQYYLNGNPIAGATSSMYTVGVDGEGTYTVQVTDANGCSALAGTSTPGSITIGDSVNTTILFIYPSPNSGRFQVRYYNDINNGSSAPAMVNVYDEKGSRVYTQRYSLGAGYNAMNVDLSTHGKGLYRVELLDLNGNRIKTGSVMVF